MDNKLTAEQEATILAGFHAERDYDKRKAMWEKTPFLKRMFCAGNFSRPETAKPAAETTEPTS